MKKNLHISFLFLLTFVSVNTLMVAGQEVIVESFTKAELPAPGKAGRVARVTDEERGLFVDTGTDWVGVAGNQIDVRWFGAKGAGGINILTGLCVNNDKTAIQNAINVAKMDSRGGTVVFPKPVDYYCLDSVLDINSAKNVTLSGTGGPTALSYSPLTDRLGSVVFTGTGDSFISARSTYGFNLRNLRIIYTNPGFTGDLVDLSALTSGGDTHYAVIDNCALRGDSSSAANARALVNLNRAIITTIRATQFGFADIGIIGKTQPDYSNAVTIENCTFLALKSVGIKNAGEAWRIIGNTVEPTLNGKAGLYDESLVSIGPVTIEGNWCGDVSMAGSPWIRYIGLKLVVRNNMLGSAGGSQAAIVIDTTGTQVDTVVLADNVYFDVENAVKVQGSSGSLRTFHSSAEQMLPRGGTRNYLTVQSPSFIIYKTILGNETEIQNEISGTQINGAFNASYVPSIAGITDKLHGSIGMFDYSVGNEHNVLGIVGKTQNGNPGSIQFWTGSNVPYRTFSIYPWGAVSYFPIYTKEIQADLTNGTPVKGIYSATTSLDFPSIAAHSTDELTITVTGATVGDSVTIAPAGALETGLMWSGYVSASNTVAVRVLNGTASPINPSSRNFRAMVTRF